MTPSKAGKSYLITCNTITLLSHCFFKGSVIIYLLLTSGKVNHIIESESLNARYQDFVWVSKSCTSSILLAISSGPLNIVDGITNGALFVVWIHVAIMCGKNELLIREIHDTVALKWRTVSNVEEVVSLTAFIGDFISLLLLCTFLLHASVCTINITLFMGN